MSSSKRKRSKKATRDMMASMIAMGVRPKLVGTVKEEEEEKEKTPFDYMRLGKAQEKREKRIKRNKRLEEIQIGG